MFVNKSNAQKVTDNKNKPMTRLLIVLDASQSMYGYWQSDVKFSVASRLLTNIIDSLDKLENVELALRVYGHQKEYPPQDCDDSKLEVPFAPKNSYAIKKRLRTIIPRGTTPIAASLEAAADDFPPCSDCRNIIILITDGIEECDGDPCAVSRALQKNGIILKPFVIGIGRDFRDDYDCVGTYFDASSEISFHKALKIVISQALNSTTAQVNLLDIYDKPTETNVNMTFYDHNNGQIKNNFIHTFNSFGVPDTMVLDPLVTYDIVVHTIPSVRKDSIKLIPGKHNIIPIKTPQGQLELKVSNKKNLLKNLQCLVRQNEQMKTLHVQEFGSTETYLTGSYDLEVLCLPRLYINDVKVNQSHTTTVEIPEPGLVSFYFPYLGYGSLYKEENNQLELIYNLDPNSTKESVILMPGNYRVVFRSKKINRSFYTRVQRFSIEPGMSKQVRIAY